MEYLEGLVLLFMLSDAILGVVCGLEFGGWGVGVG